MTRGVRGSLCRRVFGTLRVLLKQMDHRDHRCPRALSPEKARRRPAVRRDLGGREAGGPAAIPVDGGQREEAINPRASRDDAFRVRQVHHI
jgi:hypothetical protein